VSLEIYTYTDRDIARVAGVLIGAVRVARARRKIVASDLRRVSLYIIEHWLKIVRRKRNRQTGTRIRPLSTMIKKRAHSSDVVEIDIVILKNESRV
jgi:hypothetical protein